MKTYLAIAFFCLLGLSDLKAQKTEIIKYEKLESLMSQGGDKIKVINFWATWCAPCIKELPLFEKLGREDQSVTVNLISLDFAENVTRVDRFVERKQLKSQIYLLDEIDYNSWINKVDKSWSGAIPATLIINENTGQRKFVESELKEGQLEQFVAELKTN